LFSYTLLRKVAADLPFRIAFPYTGVLTTQSGIPSNTVFIGKKPIMAYVTALMMQLTSGSNEVSIKARGRAISAAVDVVEVCRRRFFEGKLHVEKITIGTEQLGEEGQVRNVSTIEITVTKRT
jgi:DNA-binding protein